MRIPKTLIAACVWGLILCFVPLFNIVGYESAAASGVVLSLLALGYMPKQVENLQKHPFVILIRAFQRGGMLILPPLILLSLNGLRVTTCAWKEGFLFWLIIPPVSIFLLQALWLFAYCLHKRWVWFITFSCLLAEIRSFYGL